MQKRKLGKRPGSLVYRARCMGMSFSYGPPADKEEMIALLRSAVDRGVTFFARPKSTARSRTKNLWAAPRSFPRTGGDRHQVRVRTRSQGRAAVGWLE